MNLQAKTLLGYVDPEAKQQEFIDAWRSHRFVLFGGAAGPGKSYMLRWSLILFLVGLFAERQIERACVALFCEDYPSLHDRQISKIQREFPPWLGKLRRGDTKEFILAPEYGSGVIMLRNLDDPSKYLSTEFAAVAVDELTRDDLQTFNDLRLRLRWPGVERPLFLGASNPGGIGHAWVKQYWLDGDFPVELRDLAREFAFVKALPTDNPHLTPQYWADLATLPEQMRRAYLEGDWSVLAGQYFDVFLPEKHVRPPQEFNLKPWATRWIGADWGFKHPAAVHWFAQPSSDLVVTYREEVKSGLTPTELATRICDLSEGEDISQVYLSPDAFRNTTGQDTIAEQMNKVFRERGLPAPAEAEDERPSGWALMYDYLKAKRWLIGNNCPNLIKTLPMLTRDDKKVEDCVKFVGDDAADSARYGMRSHFRVATPPLEVRLQERITATDPTIVAIQASKALQAERKKAQPIRFGRKFLGARRAGRQV